MNIDFHSEPDNRERMLIQLSEFSFAAYPVQINQGFGVFRPRCLRKPRRTNRSGAGGFSKFQTGSAACAASQPPSDEKDPTRFRLAAERSIVNDLRRVPKAARGRPVVLPGAAKKCHD